MKQIIYLERQDNIATIRDKLERAQTNEVVLVVPSRFAPLRDLVNLKLLKRYARNLALDLALVVKDSTTQVLAREEGFVLLPNVDKAREIRALRAAPQLVAHPTGPVSVSRQQDRVAAASRGNVGARLVALLVLLALLGGLAFGLIYLVLPSATVVLVPATQPVMVEMEIVAVPGLAEIDYGAGRIPARSVVVELQGAAETTTTDRRDIPDARASGSVVFANKTTEAVIIPKDTIVRTGAGTPVRFYTVTDVELPAERGAHARVNIIAVEPGPAGNVGRATINQVEGEASFKVDVLNDERTTGGTVKRVNVVALDDQVRLKADLIERLKREAYARMQGQLSAMEFIPAETVQLQVVSERYSHNVGEATDALSLQLTIRASGTLVGGDEANTLMLRMLERDMPAGYKIVPPTLRFAPGEVLATEGGAVRFRMQASGMAMSDISEEQVRGAIRGKTTEEARQALLDRWEFWELPQLVVSPEWVDRVPWLPYRITVRIEAAERS